MKDKTRDATIRITRNREFPICNGLFEF